MSLDRAPSAVAGVRYGAVARHGDTRGTFREVWRVDAVAQLAGGAPFVQANHSTSAAGVLRGLHLHLRQLDYWVVSAGRAFMAVVDVRPALDGLTDPPKIETRLLAPDDWVVIPAGVAHGFMALEPLDLLYLVTNLYDGTDELGFAWDDPAVGVRWPSAPGALDGRPALSVRDASNPSLTELVASLRARSA